MPNETYSHGQPSYIVNKPLDPIPVIGDMDATVSGEVEIPPATKFATKGYEVPITVGTPLDLSLLGVGEKVYFVNIKADPRNSDFVFYAERNDVTYVQGESMGMPLGPGDEKTLSVGGGVEIYMIAATSGQYIAYELLNGGA